MKEKLFVQMCSKPQYHWKKCPVTSPSCSSPPRSPPPSPSSHRDNAELDNVTEEINERESEKEAEEKEEDQEETNEEEEREEEEEEEGRGGREEPLLIGKESWSSELHISFWVREISHLRISHFVSLLLSCFSSAMHEFAFECFLLPSFSNPPSSSPSHSPSPSPFPSSFLSSTPIPTSLPTVTSSSSISPSSSSSLIMSSSPFATLSVTTPLQSQSGEKVLCMEGVLKKMKGFRSLLVHSFEIVEKTATANEEEVRDNCKSLHSFLFFHPSTRFRFLNVE
jgi:hypothetical protein